VAAIIEKYAIVVVESEPGYFIVTCGSCGGDGCTYCGYFGKRKLDVPPELDCDVGVVQCGSCKGHGCTYCRYVGAYVKCFPRVTCGSCKGNGCTYCRYVGSVWVGYLR
jgi:hypothetical protein